MTIGTAVTAGPAAVTTTDVGVLDKAAAILRLLMSASLTAGEICEALGLTRSTGYRLIAALSAHGFIVRTPTGHFILGPFPRRDVMAEVTSVLTALRDRTGESVQLWMLRGDIRACVVSVDSTHDLRISKSAGSALLVSDGGSAAHALLAEGSPSALFLTRGARTPGSGSASVAFDADGGRRLALCVSFPLARAPEDVSRALSAVLNESVQILMRIVPEGGAGDALEDIAASARLDD